MSGSTLILIAVAGIFTLLFLVMRTKLHAFVSLLLVSLLVGVAAGMPLGDVIASVQNGMGGTLGFVAVPVFFDVGFIILVPIIYGLAKKTGRSLLYYGIPLLAGLAVTHSFIPPTPGPIAVANLIGAELGWIILFGILAGIPSMILA